MKRILLALTLVLTVFPAIAEETLQESEERLIEAFEFLTKNYLYHINSESLVDRLIVQMTYDLDKSTKFLPPGRSKRHLDRLHNEDNVYVMSELVGDNILYSRITLFGAGTSRQLSSDIFEFSMKLAMKETKIKGIILDLRHNGGGWLGEAVAMTDMFIDSGLILEERGRHGDVTLSKHATSRMIISKQVPIIILMDSDTASAAEIVASALKDHNRAMLLGVQSYGKATVQSYQDFENGSTLWVTSQKYYTKSGVEIHGKGLEPNVVFHPTESVITFSVNDSQVKKAIELLR